MILDSVFRLRRLQLSGHPVLRELDITFCDDDESPVIYTTGIIGPNGTGKSHLLGAIAKVFSDIHQAKTMEPPVRRFSFAVYYCYLGDEYCVSNSIRLGKIGMAVHDYERINAFFATKNDQVIPLRSVLLPERVIASTMTVTDKFLAKTDDFYRYKGIRNENSASTTGTRTIIRKTVDSLMDFMSSKSTFQEELGTLLGHLGLETHLRVSYRMRYKHLFLRPGITPDMIRDIFINWKDHFPERKNPPWGYNNFIRNLRDNTGALKAAARFLSMRAQGLFGDPLVASYDLIVNPESFQEDALALKTLTQLDIISFPSVDVVKKGITFSFENSSSGEAHLLCQFIGIMADIHHGSLVLIDEPENSSHPQWQMSYVVWLKEIFKGYKDCHFIIATHSPLILANMKASESTIIRLKRGENNKIYDEGGMGKGCFSWTVDEILQEVMEMKSTRTAEYNAAMADFEKALDVDSKEMAEEAFKKLSYLIKPDSDLMELLRIQMIGLSND